MNKTEQAVAMLEVMIESGELAPGSMVSKRTIVETLVITKMHVLSTCEL